MGKEFYMRNVLKVFGIIALIAVIGFSFVACGGGDDSTGGTGGNGGDGGSTGGTDGDNSGTHDLSGTITISPSKNVNINTELTAIYSGSETVSYQWKKDGSNIGSASTTKPNKYTPTTAGEYTVTVSATGYNSKTSAIVDVNDMSLLTLSGNVTISPNSGVTTFTELTATYTGSETVRYQWEKDGSNVGTNSNKYTPTAAGSYSVTVSATGYNSKTSDAVDVTIADLSGTITIDPAGTIGTGIQLTAIYSGTETVSYQWKKDGSNIGSASTTKPNRYTPSAVGSYTVTVSATGYNSKTSDAVTVKTWTAITDKPFGTSTNGTSDIRKIVYGNGKFVAGGRDGKMAVSTDGITWTAVSDSTFGTSVITVIAYINDKFFVCGSSGKIATSTDGETWTAVTQSVFGSSDDINAIAYGNGKFVVGGSKGKMATSTDGETWAAVSNSNFTSSHNIRTIAYGNGKFVAGGGSGGSLSGYGRMATSTDGETWTVVSSFNSNSEKNWINNITFCNGKFFVSGYNDDYKLLYSTDGETWTAVSNSTFFGSYDINSIIYGNGKFVAVYSGDNRTVGSKTATSTNGEIWTTFIGVGDLFGYSYDGWSYKGTISSITYGNNMFVAVGYSGKMAYLLDN